MNRIPWIPSLPGPGTFPRVPNTSYTLLVFCAVLLVAAAIVPVKWAGGEGVGVVLIFVDTFGGCEAMICRVVAIFLKIYLFQAVVCRFPPFERGFRCC